MRRTESILAGAALAAAALSPAHADHDPVDGIIDSIVRVEYTLRFDKGEEPRGGTWRDPDDPDDVYAFPLEMLIEEERPARTVGFVLDETTVATADPRIHPRFIESIHVVAEGQHVPARIVATALHRPAVLLELEAPLAGAAALRFEPGAEGGLLAISQRLAGEGWITLTTSVGGHPVRREDGSRFRRVAHDAVIVTTDGEPVGVSFSGELDTEGNWRTPPSEWPMLRSEQLPGFIDSIGPEIDAQIVRVDLSFRSPSTSNASPSMMMMSFGGDDAEETERSVAGIVTGSRQVLVLALLEPKITARLERVRVHLPEGPVAASFVASLRDYGAFVAELESEASTPAVASAPLATYRNELLVAADVRIQGTNRVATLGTARIDGFRLGWRGRVYPDVVDDAGTSYLFDLDRRLIAFPISRRLPPALEEARGNYPTLTAATDLWDVLGDLEAQADPGNVPLTEADEHRIAWLGVELQLLDRELARLYGIADQTDDGMTGGLVVHLYAGAPAEEAGIQLGDILLRIDVPGQPRPIEVDVEDSSPFGFGGAYPWEHWDDMPEDFFDQVPPPWPPVDNALNRTLTEVGFGVAARVEYARDGVIRTADLTVTQAPPYYASAPRFEHEGVGLTVRDLTFEVRRYFQIPDGEPGVIVTGLEKGSKASVAGLRPFELILSVDGEAVHDADGFAALVSAPGEHRLAVQRMTQQRIVTLEVEQP